jgi:MFS family permease
MVFLCGGRRASNRTDTQRQELFNSREARYRTMLVISMAFFGQWSGNGPVSYYFPTILRGAGITDRSTRLLYNGMQNVVSFAGAIFGAFYTDSWGRRPQLLVSTACLVVIIAIVCALVATNLRKDAMGQYIYDANKTPQIKSNAQARAVIAFVFLFGFVYSTGYTPLQQLYPVECLRYESRAKGMAFYNFWVNIANFYNTFVTGIAFSGAGWKVSPFAPFPVPQLPNSHYQTSTTSSSFSGTCSNSPSSTSSSWRRGAARSRKLARSSIAASRSRRA